LAAAKGIDFAASGMMLTPIVVAAAAPQRIPRRTLRRSISLIVFSSFETEGSQTLARIVTPRRSPKARGGALKFSSC
jgi:hypothetical protein